MDQGESSPSLTDSSARTQIQLFCVTRPAIPPQVLPVPQAGTTSRSQAGLVSGGDTLIRVANLETHFLAHLSGYNSRPWVRLLNR
jgi:hypothetical protein